MSILFLAICYHLCYHIYIIFERKHFIMDKNKQNLAYFSKILPPSIPKWEDLPEIDLYMDQVIALMEKYLTDNSSQDSKLITPSMINNYVKLGIMPPPIKKKYSREHLAYLVIICSLKQVMPISNIKDLIVKRLEQNTIANLLDSYSNLYDFTFKTLLETCNNYLASNEFDMKTSEDASLFTAIAAANCRNISNKLFYVTHLQKSKNLDKKKKREN